ncbi:MAG: hypothetical protein AB2598_19695 [Candidatus Thiodiazotropha sp.]
MMKTEISQLLQVSGPVSVHPFADQIIGFQAELDTLKLHIAITVNTPFVESLNDFSDQLAAWDVELKELATPSRLVEAKAVFHAMAEFIEEPDGCSDHMAFFDDLLGAGDVLTARIAEALAMLTLAVDQGTEMVQSVIDVIDQITADLTDRLVWIADHIAELREFESRLAEAIAMVTAAADPCLKTIIERTAPPEVKEILNIT